MKGKTVDYSLKGGKVYTITQNGISFQTTESKVRLTLVDGYNEVKITTGIECQGIFEETHFNSPEVLFSPVPFNDYLTIFVGGNDRDIVVSIYSSNGRLISCDQHYLNTTNRLIKMNTDHLRQGKLCHQTRRSNNINVRTHHKRNNRMKKYFLRPILLGISMLVLSLFKRQWQ